MKHLEKRGNLYYAKLTVPQDVRHIIGKLRYFQSTQTTDKSEATVRAALLVSGWKAEVAKARGKLPDPKNSFWDGLRQQYILAKTEHNEDVQLAIEKIAEAEVGKVKDPVEAAHLWTYTTDQQGTLLAPIVKDWHAGLLKQVAAKKRKKKSVDQQHRDVTRMADHFLNLESLQVTRVKQWTDGLLEEGTTASSFERIGTGCRALWSYMQEVDIVTMDAPNPFSGPFTLAQKIAPKTTIGRTDYTPEQAAQLYTEMLRREDLPLAHLFALGAYTGARIEELCQLTKETVRDSVFYIDEGKTEASIRACPVHPAIAPLVARMLADSKDGFLVPSTADNQYNIRSDTLSKRFGKLKTALGFSEKHVFHSTRRTLITLMEHAGVPESVAADVAGHDKKTMTYGLYSGGSSMAQKREAIAKVKYPAPLDKP